VFLAMPKKRIETKRLSAIFNILRNQLKEKDKAIKEKYKKLNNEILPKFAKDKQVNFGCKGGNKFWYGFKKHTSVDMQSGMINKVAITKASTIDSKGIKHLNTRK
jgi:hypothetical protein